MIKLENHTYPLNAMKITFSKYEIRVKLNVGITPPDDVSKILSLIQPQEMHQTLRSGFVNIPQFIAGGRGVKLFDSSKKKNHIANYMIDTQTITYKD